MQNNPLQIIGGNILQEYESVLVAGVFKGMETLFEIDADAWRLGGDFLPGLFAKGRTSELVEAFTEGFVPNDLLPSNAAAEEAGSDSSSRISSSKRTPFRESPARQDGGNASNFRSKFGGENSSNNEPISPAQPEPKAPNQAVYPLNEKTTTNWPHLPDQAFDKPAEYLDFLNKNEQKQSSFLQQNPTAPHPNPSPDFSQNTAGQQHNFFENPEKNEMPSGTNAELQPQLLPHTSHPSFQPLKNLKDFAQLFGNHQSMTQSDPNSFHLQTGEEKKLQQNHRPSPVENDHTLTPELSAPINFSQNTPPTVDSDKNKNDAPLLPLSSHVPKSEAPIMDDIMDELAQRLTREYRRFYG